MLPRLAVPVTLLLAGTAPLARSQDVGTIQFGQRLTAQLTPRDAAFEDGSHYKVFVFEGSRGDSVSISLVSQDFDAYLIIATDLQVREIGSDDNSGRCWDAFVSTVLPDSGRFAVYAGAVSPGEVGGFELSLERGLLAAPEDDGCRGFVNPDGRLGLGDSIVGSLAPDDRYLSDSAYYELWLVTGTAGKTFTVELRSKEFDSVLMLLQGLGGIVAVDDDGAGGCDARIVYPNAGGVPLRIVARTRGDWQMGEYTLRVTEGATAAVPQPPCEGRPAGQPPARR